jgi:type VI secretion system VasI family protein
MRNKMRVIAVTIAIFALSQAATAQTPECKSIAASGERLACYDKATAPAKTTQRSAASKAPTADPAKYVDTISAEDARMNAQLKNICRGC